MCRLVPETGIRPNLDLDFVFLTFLKNIVFLYLGSNQVSKLLNNWLKLIGGRTTLMVARDWGGRLPGVLSVDIPPSKLSQGGAGGTVSPPSYYLFFFLYLI